MFRAGWLALIGTAAMALSPVHPSATAGLEAEDRAAIRAFTKAFPDVSEQEAWQRINAEDERATLISRLAQEEADTFGGSWYDGATDTQHLQATTAGAADRYARLSASLDIKAQVHQVEYTYRDLAAAAGNGGGIDVRSNRVVGPDLADQVVSDACPSRSECDRPLRSGLEQWKGSPGNRTCSLGFVAGARDHPNQKYVITAGHCGGIGDTFGHDTHEFGQVEKHRNSGDVDALAVRIENTYWLNASFGWIYRPNGDGKPPFSIDARITSETPMQAGQVVCLSARKSTTNHYCGVLDAVDSDHRGMARVRGLDACTGDSGGAWYRKADGKRTAYGIHSGSSEGCHTSDGVSYFSTLPAVQNAFDLNVETRG